MELIEELRTWDAIPSDDTVERTGALKYLRELCDTAADEIERLLDDNACWVRVCNKRAIELAEREAQIAVLHEALRESVAVLDWYYNQYADSNASVILEAATNVLTTPPQDSYLKAYLGESVAYEWRYKSMRQLCEDEIDAKGYVETSMYGTIRPLYALPEKEE